VILHHRGPAAVKDRSRRLVRVLWDVASSNIRRSKSSAAAWGCDELAVVHQVPRWQTVQCPVYEDGQLEFDEGLMWCRTEMYLEHRPYTALMRSALDLRIAYTVWPFHLSCSSTTPTPSVLLSWRYATFIKKICQLIIAVAFSCSLYCSCILCFFTCLHWWRLFVCMSACVSVCTKSRKLLVRNRCNLVGLCPMGDFRSGWKLVIFDLDFWPWELFSYFLFAMYMSSSSKSFEYLSVATSFSVWRYMFRISRLPSSFKVIGLISRSQQRESGRAQVCAPLGHSLTCICVYYVNWCIKMNIQQL